MADYIFKTILDPSPEQIGLIVKPLKQYNESKIGPYSLERVAICAYDQADKLIGGIYGWIAWGWLYIDDLWVDESMRHQGVGSKLLSACEEFAIQRHIQNARVNTGSFQAPDFYKKNGYEIFAQLDIVAGDGSAQIDYFMRKKLEKSTQE